MADPLSSDFDWQAKLSERAILGGLFFDIAKAKAFIKTTPRPVEQKPLSTFKPMYYLMDIKIDWEKAKQTDLKFPVIAGPHEGSTLIVDGWHRYAWALRQNLPDIPVVMLTEEEMTAVKKR